MRTKRLSSKQTSGTSFQVVDDDDDADVGAAQAQRGVGRHWMEEAEAATRPPGNFSLGDTVGHNAEFLIKI